MRQLELLLVPLHHRFRYPLPVPAHLASGAADEEAAAASGLAFQQRASASMSLPYAGAADLADSVLSTSAAAAGGDAAELTPEERDARLHRCALQVVKEQVPDLLTWQTRVQRGAAQASNCHQVLERVRSSVAAMQRVTASVQEQSDHLSHNASAMMVRKAKLELVRDALEQNLAHFTHIDDLCREAGNPFLKAGTARFSVLLQDIAKEMEFLSANTQYKSAKPYAMKLAVAQQTVSATLKDAVRASFQTMEQQTTASAAFRAATHVMPDADASPGDPVAAAAAAASASAPMPSTSPTTGLAALSASTSVLSLTPTGMMPVASGGSSLTPAPSPPLRLQPHDVAGSFDEFLAAVNAAFVASGDAFTSLRRMAELRQGGFSYSGAEAFGEEMVTAGGRIEADPGMREVMDAYRDARVGVVVPLLRYWLTLWYYLDSKSAQQDAQAAASGAAVAAAAAIGAGLPADSGAARQQLSGVAEAHTLPQLAEHLCGLLQRSLAAESSVLAQMWLRDDIVSHLLPKLVSSIAEEVYYVFRSRLLCVDDVGELARTVESIQRVSLRPNTGVQDSQVVSDLWVRMIQDTQERLVFRTSVYLRQTVSRCTPTREMAGVYLRCGTGAYTGTLEKGADGDAAAEARMFYIPGVVHALQLLHWLYPTLEFSVFSVFAEEAVHHSLELVRQLVKLMRQQDASDPLRDAKAFLCQLAHLQHLQEVLSHVDANITVVEKHISFAALRKRRLELEQSSRESKKEVEVDLLKCSEYLTTAMLAVVTQPVTGAAKKSDAERRLLASEMKGRAAAMERMIAFYVEHGETRQDLVHLLRERVAELAAEISVDVDAVPAAPPVLPAPTAAMAAVPSVSESPAAAAAAPTAQTTQQTRREAAPASAPQTATTAAAGDAPVSEAPPQALPAPPPAFPSPPTEHVTVAAATATPARHLPPPSLPSQSATHTDTELI